MSISVQIDDCPLYQNTCILTIEIMEDVIIFPTVLKPLTRGVGITRINCRTTIFLCVLLSISPSLFNFFHLLCRILASFVCHLDQILLIKIYYVSICMCYIKPTRIIFKVLNCLDQATLLILFGYVFEISIPLVISL